MPDKKTEKKAKAALHEKKEHPQEKKEQKAASEAKAEEVRSEKKEQAKKEEKGSKKEGSEKKAKAEKKVFSKKSKPKEIKKLSEMVRKKKRTLFRGRFGKKNVRKISNKKWQKWRCPRGMDIYFEKEDGAYPKMGYGTNKLIRGRHPSGYNEVLVCNEKDVEEASKKSGIAIKFARVLGKRKRKILLEKAEKLGLVVLNG